MFAFLLASYYVSNNSAWKVIPLIIKKVYLSYDINSSQFEVEVILTNYFFLSKFDSSK
jgi:hypothetical protein